MTLGRRSFLRLAAQGALVAGAAHGLTVQASPGARFRAVAFDGFPIFDPRPVARLAESLYPGRGGALINAWRTRQFEYQWLRALAGRYQDFLQATEDALVFAAKQTGLDVDADARGKLMSAWSELDVWPDVPPAIDALREAGVRLAILSNMTQGMLERGLERAGLSLKFDATLSTGLIDSYKPEPRSYRLVLDVLELERDQILFAAFAGWDVAGAKWFGYPTFWVNRQGSPSEVLGIEPDGSGPDLAALVKFVLPEAVV
jgi:2-haloacid dehalogenase